MAGFAIHVSQANHNEGVASYLLNSPYFDWSIISCFYAAIHYIEAYFYFKEAGDDKHTETCIPVDSNGKFQCSPHSWRERRVRNISRSLYINFRSLRVASETIRYLSNSSGQSGSFQNAPSYDLFDKSNSESSIKVELSAVKDELKISLLELLNDLNLELKVGVIAPLLIDKIVGKFSSKEEFMGQTPKLLRRHFSQNEITTLMEAMLDINLSFQED